MLLQIGSYAHICIIETNLFDSWWSFLVNYRELENNIKGEAIIFIMNTKVGTFISFFKINNLIPIRLYWLMISCDKSHAWRRGLNPYVTSCVLTVWCHRFDQIDRIVRRGKSAASAGFWRFWSDRMDRMWVDQ